jgi:folliculin
VFFGDARLNSLCFSFKVKDSFARGFETLFSITVVMKDKMFLLNTQPFLAENIREIAKRIQDSAHRVYDSEQKQFSQRAERLNSGKMSDLQPRSLRDLVGEQNIFAHLHSLFAWILFAGSRYFTEVLTLGSSTLPAFARKEAEGFAFISIDREEFLMQNFADTSDFDGTYCLRHLRELVSPAQFNQLLYCGLVGVQIVVRGHSLDFYKYFKEFMPQAFHRLFVESSKYVPASKGRILTLPSTDIVVPSLSGMCRVDFIGASTPFIKCSVDVPSKPPALLTKIVNAVDEKLFTSVTMHKFVQAVVEEWKNKVVCLSHQHDHDVSKLKKVLGIQPNDELLVSYWLSVL